MINGLKLQPGPATVPNEPPYSCPEATANGLSTALSVWRPCGDLDWFQRGEHRSELLHQVYLYWNRSWRPLLLLKDLFFLLSAAVPVFFWLLCLICSCSKAFHNICLCGPAVPVKSWSHLGCWDKNWMFVLPTPWPFAQDSKPWEWERFWVCGIRPGTCCAVLL